MPLEGREGGVAAIEKAGVTGTEGVWAEECGHRRYVNTGGMGTEDIGTEDIRHRGTQAKGNKSSGGTSGASEGR